MQYYIEPIAKLIEQFGKLPGIGSKTAGRLAFAVVSMPEDDAKQFADAILAVKASVKYCSVCQNLSDTDICRICADESRDKSVICVVETPKDVMAIEASREFTGLYHVLHGVISPTDGIGPENIRIRELLARLTDGTVTEVIMATNSTVEGDATAMYISKLLKPAGIKVTRLAYGIPVGGELEYADRDTLARAIDGRREL